MNFFMICFWGSRPCIFIEGLFIPAHLILTTKVGIKSNKKSSYLKYSRSSNSVDIFKQHEFTMTRLSTFFVQKYSILSTSKIVDSDLSHFTFQCSCVHILDMDFTHHYQCSTFSRLMNLVQEKEFGWTSAVGYPYTTKAVYLPCCVLCKLWYVLLVQYIMAGLKVVSVSVIKTL